MHYVAGFFDGSLINVIGVVDKYRSGEKSAYGNIISPLELSGKKFDWLIITSIKYADEIFKDAVSMGIPPEKIIKPAMSGGQMIKVSGLLTQWGLGEVNFLKQDKIEQELAAVKEIWRSIRQGQNIILKRTDLLIKKNKLQFLKNHYESKGKDFVIENFVEKPELGRKVVFDNREDYREYIAPMLRDKSGLFLEFGVFEGKTINHMSRLLTDKIFYGFDSFEGLPEEWHNGYEKGHFSLEGRLPAVNPNVRLVKGWFDDTLPDFLKEHPGDCAYIHIDCDLYSSSRYVLNELRNRIVKGTVILFDELIGYIGYEQDEYRAFTEFIEETGHEYRYLACSCVWNENGEYIACAVEITE